MLTMPDVPVVVVPEPNRAVPDTPPALKAAPERRLIVPEFDERPVPDRIAT